MECLTENRPSLSPRFRVCKAALQVIKFGLAMTAAKTVVFGLAMVMALYPRQPLKLNSGS